VSGPQAERGRAPGGATGAGGPPERRAPDPQVGDTGLGALRRSGGRRTPRWSDRSRASGGVNWRCGPWHWSEGWAAEQRAPVTRHQQVIWQGSGLGL
ncbi:unnamed protein product, partial [Staurois parvus]